MTQKSHTKTNDDQRGAALVMVLMISFLLLVASAGLLLETSMNTANVTDVIAEQQAYASAESGIQAAINVLRGNVAPSPLIDSTKPATDPANQIDIIKALRLSSANTTGDPSTYSRLSRWINYSYAPTSLPVNEHRVPFGVPPGVTYDPNTHFAYRLNITDPDKVGFTNSFSTVGKMEGCTSYTVGACTKDYGTAPNQVRIEYTPVNVVDLDVSSSSAVTNLGTFNVSCFGTCAAVTETRFSIKVTMTRPYNSVQVFRGTIVAGNVTQTSLGGVKLRFDSEYLSIMGSKMTLTGGTWVSPPPTSITPTSIIGYEIPLNTPASSAAKQINITMTQAEPIRLSVRSFGYGPRGARKELEAIVKKNFFDGMPAPATLTLVGPSPGFRFNLGSSNALTYSGVNAVAGSNIKLPPIGVTNDPNLAVVRTEITTKGSIIGKPENVLDELPAWLGSPNDLDAIVQSLKEVAIASNRYFPSGTTPSTFGDMATGKGITYIDGNAKLSGSGGGILICTGIFDLGGGLDFKGMILITGAGGVTRTGGGNGVIHGAMVVAPYNPSNLTDNNPANDVFLSPQYDLSGGGSSKIQYNSDSISNGLIAVTNIVHGVTEK